MKYQSFYTHTYEGSTELEDWIKDKKIIHMSSNSDENSWSTVHFVYEEKEKNNEKKGE